MKTERKGYQKAVLVIAVFTILTGALYATDNFRKIPQNKSGSSILKRNEHGQGEKNQKLVAKTKDQKAKITVEIQEQSYTQEELQRVFDTAGKKLETLILGENKSLDEVRYDLNLVKTVPDTGIEVSWELSDYQTVNILGELQDKNLSEEGTTIELKALLTYGDAKAEHQFSARVFPPKLDDAGQFQRQLEKKMKEADETDRESGYVVLPDEIEGKTISWHYAKDMRSVGIFVLGIVAAALMLVLEKQNEIQKRRHADISWQWIIRNLSVHLHCIWEPECLHEERGFRLHRFIGSRKIRDMCMRRWSIPCGKCREELRRVNAMSILECGAGFRSIVNLR